MCRAPAIACRSTSSMSRCCWCAARTARCALFATRAGTAARAWCRSNARRARITCPYHGWTYALDGRLLGVPKSRASTASTKRAAACSRVRTECWGGFVWITFDADAPPLAEYLGALPVNSTPYRLEEMRPLLRRSWTLPCNWKAVLDQATESYHLKMVHGRSVGSGHRHGLDFPRARSTPPADHPHRRLSGGAPGSIAGACRRDAPAARPSSCACSTST